MYLNTDISRPPTTRAPQTATIKDDAIYVVDLASQSVVSTYGASSHIRDMAHYQGLPLKVGQALMHGSHLRWWARKLYERNKAAPPAPRYRATPTGVIHYI